MKERLDVLLVKRGLAPSRERAKAAVRAGAVFADGKKADRPGALYEDDAVRIEVKSAPLPYVSRGGLKLEKALETFSLGLQGSVCMDIGASAGGFTDCMLQHGAARVYAVDVGHGQLAQQLRNDPRVVCMEGVNFRYMTGEEIPEETGFISADVSFISLSKILVPARRFLKAGGRMVCLVKPQFEAGRENVGKKGVVKEPSVHRRVLEKIVCLAELTGFSVIGLTFSPIRGPEGNIEYLLCLGKAEPAEKPLPTSAQEAEERLAAAAKDGLSCRMDMKALIGRTVETAHGTLRQMGAGEPI